MCSTPKTSLAAKMPETPFRSFMASMTLAQRKRFAEVANRAQERRDSTEHYRQGLSSQHKSVTSLSLWEKLKQLCAQTVNLMG
ncbi:hypothetical protein FM037_08410 [Shewanella psychropiezotolerans]|uniref:Uncharacterized protein n=1 Tax=Shewanella psychropiezotolerans TaxID=2593655 RepID=A0ABX5WZT6_9GAMM|nr:hypothetical protein [Shewanella psychropiezotolerans]QDO83248.1 hypothetical protein FM037_08410 [Shewanella psychropiezotolerans]